MIRFHGEQLSTSRTTRKLEDHPLSAFREYLFNARVFEATLHIGGRSSTPPNLRSHSAMVTGTNLTRASVNNVHNSILSVG